MPRCNHKQRYEFESKRQNKTGPPITQILKWLTMTWKSCHTHLCLSVNKFVEIW